MISRGEGWLPVDGTPVGLITWFVPAGPAVAVLASWLAVINGRPPELRAGCAGRGGDSPFPVGRDFAVNVFANQQLPRYCVPGPRPDGLVILDEPSQLLPARLVNAPLLAGCALQIECADGRILPGEWEPELVGDILLLHRDGLFIDPSAHPDFCALRPLHIRFPS